MASLPPQPAGDQGVVDWASLKKLIALQESQQPNLMQPEQLTPALLRAITELNRATSAALEALSTTVAPEEPDLGGKDWVSLLQRYRDAHSDGTYIKYKDESRGLKWCTFTTLSEAGDLVFPMVGIPCAKKKDAKQYAARQAVEWLMANQLMPDDGINVNFKKAKECPPTPSSTNSGIATGTPPKPGPSPPVAGAAQLPPTPKSRGRDHGSGDDSDEDNVIVRVEKMCRSFGFGTPRYVITPVENTSNLFNGTVNWGDEFQVPESVGVVINIYGRRYAKELMAQEVLQYLTQVSKQRGAEKQEVLRTLESQRRAAAVQSSSGSWGSGLVWPLGSGR